MKLETALYTLTIACGYSRAEHALVGLEAPEQGERTLWHQSQMLQTVLSYVFPDWQDAYAYIFRYGCYCHRNSKRFAASQNGYHGPPLDDLDSLCRDSFRAQKCLEDEFNTKFTTDEKRDRGYPWYLDSNTNKIVCNNEEFPNWAEKEDEQLRLRNCLIEKEFVENVVSLLSNTDYVRKDEWSRMNEVKYAKVCPVDVVQTGRSNEMSNECCGSGMTRRPFNSAVMVCCNNEIQELGTC